MADIDKLTHIPDPSQATDQAKAQLGNPQDYMPPAPPIDPSALPQQLPGGLGDAVSRASQLSDKMQGMSCPNFNPGMPGADMAKEMSQHLQTMSDSAQQIMNPAQQELSNVQNAISSIQNLPNPSNPSQSQIDTLNQSLQNLQNKTSQVYGNVPAAQKASEFANSAQARANNERDIAQQRATNAMQQETQKYNDLAQQAQQKYQDTQNKASSEASQYQQQAQEYQAKAQAAQQAYQNMQVQLPPYQGPDASQLPQNPYQNLNGTLQNISVPDCPQLADLQNQLASAQGQWQQVMSGYDSLTPTLQGVNDMSIVLAALPESVLASIDTNIDAIKTALGGKPASVDEESAQDGGAAPTMPVVNGGKGMCPMAMGAQFNVITVPTGSEVNMQQKAQPLQAQFMCPGMCMSLANPITAAQTAASLGVLNPGKCLIMAKSPIPPAWQPTTTGKFMGNGQPFLLAPSNGVCMYGGPLMMLDAGQEEVTAAPGA